MEDLKNGYLNEQGLRQERDALRVENARLREALREIGREQSAKTATEAADKFQNIARSAIEMSGGVK